MAQRKVNCEVYTDRGIVGKEGADGKSAYQQAVSGGYQGTEEEFEQALASDISVVADNVTNINAVGNNIENVNTVAGNATNINTVATNISSINTAATNMPAIIAAPTEAANAANSATEASASATIATTQAELAKEYASIIDMSNYRTASDQDIIDATKVSKAGDTMSGPLTIVYNSQKSLVVKDNRIEMGVATDSNIYTEMVEAFDKNDKRVASIEHAKVAGGGSRATLQSVKEINGENKYAQIHVGFDSSNNMYAACPTPSNNSNSNNIATTQWVRNHSVAKAGDTMSGNLNLNARLTLGTYKDTQADIKFSGVGGSYYQFVNNSTEEHTFLQLYDENARGLVLIKELNSQPFYFDGTQPLRLLTTADFGSSSIGENLAPDYSAAVTIPNNAVYTAPANGWIMGYAGQNDWSSYSLIVNNITFLYGGRKSYNTGGALCFFIGKGQTVHPRADAILRFVPCIGA